MSIKLPGGAYTREPAVDHRLKRILQVCGDIVGKPLAQCRVLDLACLEGHYALEFAAHGSEVVGIEGRAASVAKCNFARDALGFDRAVFHQDDVRNLSVAKYGVFDIVICSGLLYHLPAHDAWALIRAMHDVCRGIVVVDTFIALADRVSVELDGTSYHGHVYGEHGAGDSGEAKARANRIRSQATANVAVRRLILWRSAVSQIFFSASTMILSRRTLISSSLQKKLEKSCTHSK